MTPPIETPSGLQGVEAPAEGPDGDGRSRSEVGKLAAATPDTSGVVAWSSAGPATAPSSLSELCSTAPANESEVKR